MQKTVYELPQTVSDTALQLRASEARCSNAINPHVERLSGQRMYLGFPELRNDFVLAAEDCHLRYAAATDARMAALQDSYLRLGQPHELIVMILCSNFSPMFKNWLASCDFHGIAVRDRLLVFTLDATATEQVAGLGIETCFLDPSSYMPGGGSSAYGDRQFSRTMFYKNAVVSDALILGANVLFQDVDLVWFKDPFPYLREHCAANDIAIMFDGNNPHHGPIYANTGFIHVACTSASRALFETAARNTASIFQCRSHQRPFNHILAFFALHNVLGLSVLPETRFLNGHLFNLERGVSARAGDWKRDGYVMHYSWTADRAEKQQKLDRFGLNYCE